METKPESMFAQRTKGVDEKFCESCGEIIKIRAEVCPKCGVRQKSPFNKTALLLLTFFLGGFGAHKFYLKKYGQGTLYILFCWTFIPSIIAFIEFLIYAFSSTEDLERKYPSGHSGGAGIVAVIIIGVFAAIMMLGIVSAVAIPLYVGYMKEEMKQHNAP